MLYPIIAMSFHAVYTKRLGSKPSGREVMKSWIWAALHASITEDSGLSSLVPSLTLYDKVPMAVNFENSYWDFTID